MGGGGPRGIDFHDQLSTSLSLAKRLAVLDARASRLQFEGEPVPAAARREPPVFGKSGEALFERATWLP